MDGTELVTFGERLDNASLWIDENIHAKCVMGSVYGPLSLRVNLLESWNQLECFQASLNQVYDPKMNEKIPPVLHRTDIQPGMYVGVKNKKEEWFRGQIMTFSGRKRLCKVIAIDYGFELIRSPDDLRYLPRDKFGSLTAQSIPCKFRLSPLHENYIKEVVARGPKHNDKILGLLRHQIYNKDLVGLFRSLKLDAEKNILVWEVDLSILEEHVGQSITMNEDVAMSLIDRMQDFYPISN